MTMDYEKIKTQRNTENQFAKYNNIIITKLSEGYAKVEMLVDERKMNPIGTVHGGCIFTMCDICAGSAAFTRGHWVTTVNAEINYLRPAKNAKHLTAENIEIKVGKTLIVNEVVVKDENETELARGTFTCMVIDKT